MKPSLSPEKLLILLRSNKLLLLGILGFLLVAGGLILSKSFNLSGNNFTGSKVEILDNQKVSTTSGELVLEVSGAVEKPGVYKLSIGSRVNDLLVAAGGLSVDADRSWVDKNINKAAKLVDGQKVYIPAESEVLAANTSSENIGDNGGGATFGSLININSASQKELESLVGIGPTYAANIIEQRPYSDVSELTSKKIIPQKTFDKIKDKISVY